MKKLTALLLALAMMLSLAACGGSADSGNDTGENTDTETTTEDAAEENDAASEVDTSVLKVALTNSFTGAGAINTANPYRFATLSQVYECLLGDANGTYEGVLAESWEMTEPGVWAIKLYEGITDSEGNPLTASDVAFSLQKQKEAGFDESKYYDDNAVEVVDDLNLVFTMNTDSEGAFYTIACKMFIVTEAAYNNSPDAMATTPVGTGPYVVTNLMEGSSCTLSKRADYWKTENIPAVSQANYDTIEISFVPEATQMAIAISSGEVQFAGQVDLSVSSQIDSLDTVSTTYLSNGTYNGVAFNMNGRDISTNLALRQAVAYAIDPQGLIDSVYSGHGTVMTTYSMPTAIDYDENWTNPYSYDPEKAKEKLAEAGYADGVTLTLLANNVGEDAQIAELVQGYLSMVGITVEFDYVDPATQDARRAEGNWDLNLAGGMGVVDSYLFYGNLYGKLSTGMSKYFHNDSALYDIWDPYAAIGGKTTEALQALYEYESANCTWVPMFNKQVLYVTANGYGDIVTNSGYMSLPYLGTLGA